MDGIYHLCIFFVKRAVVADTVPECVREDYGGLFNGWI